MFTAMSVEVANGTLLSAQSDGWTTFSSPIQDHLNGKDFLTPFLHSDTVLCLETVLMPTLHCGYKCFEEVISHHDHG